MVMKKKKRRSSGITVDFTGVEASSRSISDGRYTATVKSVELTESEEGKEYLKWKWEITPKKGPVVVVYDNTSLQPQALWRLRLLLESLGESIEDGEMNLDPENFVGREVTVEIVNEKYEGRDQPRITGFSAGEEEEESEDEEEEEKPKKKKKKKEEDDEDDDDEDEKDKDDDDDDDEDEKPSKKSKFKVGAKVKFHDEDDDKTVKGVITSIDDDTATVEDKEGSEWQVETSELKSV